MDYGDIEVLLLHYRVIIYNPLHCNHYYIKTPNLNGLNQALAGTMQ